MKAKEFMEVYCFIKILAIVSKTDANYARNLGAEFCTCPNSLMIRERNRALVILIHHSIFWMLRLVYKILEQRP